ncbi:Hypothetical predicted protein, partial [Paramuricea clavata]
YKDELDFLSKNIRPRLIEIDTSIKEKAQQARECMDAAREKHGYSIVYKSAKRKRKSGKSSMSARASQAKDGDYKTTTLINEISDSDSESIKASLGQSNQGPPYSNIMEKQPTEVRRNLAREHHDLEWTINRLQDALLKEIKILETVLNIHKIESSD